jgi:K+-sensing histidine kinase KdpD
LLALIETILDAARVEAGQLSLLIEPIFLSDLLGEAIAKAKDLAGDRQIDIVGEFADTIGRISIDRVRGARALATIIAYAARHSQGEPIHVRASRIAGHEVQIDVNFPSRHVTKRHLKKMLSPTGSTRSVEHRGLVLGMSLAQAIIEHHSGHLEVSEERDGTPTLSVILPPTQFAEATDARLRSRDLTPSA